MSGLNSNGSQTRIGWGGVAPDAQLNEHDGTPAEDRVEWEVPMER